MTVSFFTIYIFLLYHILLNDTTIILMCSWVSVHPGCSPRCHSPPPPHKLLSMPLNNQWTDCSHKEGETWIWRLMLSFWELKTGRHKHSYADYVKHWGCNLASVVFGPSLPLLWRCWSIFIDKSTPSIFHKAQPRGDCLACSLMGHGDPRPSFPRSHLWLKDPWQATFLLPLLAAALLPFWWLQLVLIQSFQVVSGFVRGRMLFKLSA